ncbi:MAG TPA: FtsX-like permease family protein, partial [Dehalococcoidia bacterium]|nr:FtsX-like permease family protein [Dehalococcoidia bacterium]
MNELFGISMDLIMYVLVCLLALSLGSVIFVMLRNRIMFKLGVRNIPRRRAQTTLIVLGLMLSTVIISAAFTTGDTVDRSITSQVYSVLGTLDEQVVVGQRDDEEVFGDDPSEGAVREDTFPASSVDSLIEELAGNPKVDAVIPVFGDVAVAVNQDKRLSAPLFNVVGLDPQAAAGLPDLREAGGDRVEVADLGPSEIYVNESAAEELDAEAGDTITLFTNANSRDFTIKAIVKDARLAGSVGISTRREGGVLPLNGAQQFFNATGQLTMVAISNDGDARSGVSHSDDVEAAALAALPSLGEDKTLTVQAVKQTSVDLAEEFGNIFTSFFLALGLFSIGAGVLLIFMIFVMLAAERKSEMGMARAIGTRRMDLVQTFLSEGMAYNVLAAAVGTAIGVVVAVGMSQIMAALFANTNLDISPYVTPRSLIISYSLGVVLTFLTVTFSSWRISLINIVRAIRDIPEPTSQRPNWRSSGFIPTLRRLIFKPGRGLGMWASRLGLLFLGFVIVSLSGYVESSGLQALLGTVGGILLLTFVFRTFQLGPLFLLVGSAILLIFVTSDSESAFLLLFGLSLAPLGLAFTLRSFGLHERATYTVLGLYLIYLWEFDPWDFVILGVDVGAGVVNLVFGETQGDIEMFFLSGVMV